MSCILEITGIHRAKAGDSPQRRSPPGNNGDLLDNISCAPAIDDAAVKIIGIFPFYGVFELLRRYLRQKKKSWKSLLAQAHVLYQYLLALGYNFGGIRCFQILSYNSSSNID